MLFPPKDFIQNPQLPITAKDLLRKLKNKELTFEQFLAECAYWSLKDGFNQLYPKSSPAKPSEAVELENMPESEKIKFNYLDYFSKNLKVKDYYEKQAEIKNWNKASEEWLEDMFKYIPEEDFASRGKIKTRILEFRSKC